MESTLVERVQASIHASGAPVEWGSALLSTTPAPIAIEQLALQLASVEKALGEVALEVQVIAREVRELAGMSVESPA